METPFTKLFGTRKPIVLGPMGVGITTPELVAAVCDAGGLGGLGAHMVPANALEAAVTKIRELTGQPFAVNLLVAPFGGTEGDPDDVAAFLNRFRDELGLEHVEPPAGPPPFMRDAQLDVMERLGVPVWSMALGLDRDMIERAHACGAKVIGTATTVREAQELALAGVDAVVAQGAEAGGHRSTFEIGPDRQGALIGTLALVPQIVDAVDVPVVAAGGIMDGRGVVAALALGASAAQLGTRFLLAHESGIPDVYRQRLIDAVETDTVVTPALTGRPTRTIRNKLVEAWLSDGPEPLAWMTQAVAAFDIYGAAASQGNIEHMLLQAGQGLRLATRISGAAEIVDDLMREARSVSSSLSDTE